MKAAQRRALFLERRSYRRRRLQDAALILPVLAAVLFVMPLVGLATGPDESGSTRAAGLYFFGVWFLLILAAALLARRLRGVRPTED